MLESGGDAWYLLPVVSAAGSSADVDNTVPSFQGDCTSSCVCGEQVSKRASSEHCTASSLQEMEVLSPTCSH